MDQQILKNKQTGYIALISAIIISIMLVGITFGVSQAGYFSRFGSLDAEYKKISKGLAESCINIALLKIAEDPNYNTVDPVNGDFISPPGCRILPIVYDPVSGYDPNHQKTARIVATAQYPADNGTFSKIETGSTIQDPQYAAPSKITARVFTYGVGADTPDHFNPIMVTGGASPVSMNSGDTKIFSQGAYLITETADEANYTTAYAGDCDASGNLQLGANDYKTCNILNTIKPQTATLTVIISSSDGTMPGSLTIDGTSYMPQDSRKIILQSELNADGSNKPFNLAIGNYDTANYSVSDWSGTDCAGAYDNGQVLIKKGDNKVCALAYNKNPVSSQAALKVVLQVVNSYSGSAKASDFTVDVAANNPAKSEFAGEDSGADGNGGTIINVDAGTFNVTQKPFNNYKTTYQNCQGTAQKGTGYVCVITDVEQPNTFTVTAAASFTGTPPAGFSWGIKDSGGNVVAENMDFGSSKSGLLQGSYKVYYSGLPSDYDITAWGGDCAAGGTVAWSAGYNRYKTCQINVSLRPAPRASVKVVVQTINNYGGSAKPADFTVNVTAGHPSQTTFPGASGTTVEIDSGNFNITQTGPSGYQTSYDNSGTNGHLCQGVAGNYNAYVCVIKNNDILNTATLAVVANVNNKYGGTLAPSAIALKLDGGVTTSGAAVGSLKPGTHTVTFSGVPAGYTPASGWGQDCTANGTVNLLSGDIKTCTIAINQNPPPVPDCADTVMMLDRTPSMFGDNDPYYNNHPEWIAGERAAAKALVDLYNPLLTHPLLGIGSFAASANIFDHLNTNYTSYKNDIDSNLATYQYSTNIEDAITKSNIELQSKADTKPKVLIMLSDGQPNTCNTRNCDAVATAATAATNAKNAGTQIYTVNFGSVVATTGYGTSQDYLASLANNSAVNYITTSSDTGVKYPTATATPSNWTNPTYVYANDSNFASSSVLNQQQTYSHFGVSAIPGTAIINGIEVVVDGKVTTSAQNATVYPNAVGNFDPSSQWGTNGGLSSDTGKINAVKDTTNTDSTYIATNVNRSAQTFKLDTSAIPAGSVINSITLSVRGQKGGSGTPTFSLRVENGTGSGAQSDYPVTGSLSSSSFGSFSGPTWTKNPITNAIWGKVEDISAVGFGIIKTNTSSASVRISQISVVINYTPLLSSSQISVSLSSNGGSTWTGSKTAILTGTETAQNPSGNNSTDTWGQVWNSGNFADSQFILRLTNNSSSGTTVNVNYVTVKIHYTTQTVNMNCASGNSGENCDGDNFYISPTSADMAGIFTDIGKKVCPALTYTPPTPPTTGTLYVITSVNNDNGGSAKSSDFSLNVTGINPSETFFNGVAAPGEKITLSPGSYGVSENAMTGYDSYFDPDMCSGTIAAGQTITCTISNYDIPPTPPTPTLPPAPQPPATPPTTVSVVTHVINDNNIVNKKTAGGFAITVTGGSPTPAAFDGSEAGVDVILHNPGDYEVVAPADPDYLLTKSDNCKSNLAVGESVTCSLIYDDIPTTPVISVSPPPPPPPLDSIPATLVVVTSVNNVAATYFVPKLAPDFHFTIDNPSPADYAGSDTGVMLTNLIPDQNYHVVALPDATGSDEHYSFSEFADCTGKVGKGETNTCVIICTANPAPPPPVPSPTNIDITSWTEQ